MQSMGELSHAQANTLQDSLEAGQGDYFRLVGIRQDFVLVPTIDPIVLLSKM